MAPPKKPAGRRPPQGRRPPSRANQARKPSEAPSAADKAPDSSSAASSGSVSAEGGSAAKTETQPKAEGTKSSPGTGQAKPAGTRPKQSGTGSAGRTGQQGGSQGRAAGAAKAAGASKGTGAKAGGTSKGTGGPGGKPAPESTQSAADERRMKREAAREERIAVARRMKRAKRRKQVGIAIAVAVVLLGGIIFFVHKSSAEKSQVAQAAKDAGCGQVLSFKNQGRRHLKDQNETYDKYNSNPPTSGPHSPQPAPWGSYREEVAKQTLVHNLEHGGIVVHYKGLNSKQVDTLEKYVDSYIDALISNPNESIDKPIVMTAWTHMQKCDRLSTRAIQGFVDEFCGKGPEKLTTCRR
jgi:hypothetical protein